MTSERAWAAGNASALARHLTDLSVPGGEDMARWWPQSLASGAAGIALLHIERAHTGLGEWSTAHSWLATAASRAISAGSNAGLFLGAPAVAFALRAGIDGASGYERALGALDQAVKELVRRRLDTAHARLDVGERPGLAEWDLIYGLTGLGVYLLKGDPGGEELPRVLSYLVRLSRPVRIDGPELPGWWADHPPTFDQPPGLPGGHANFGMAHGISGPLALLSLAARDGVTVDGHHEAIERICAGLDAWRQQSVTGPWWPYWVTRSELNNGRTTWRGPGRPSWCYGTPGLARAQQLAGLAIGDPNRQRVAERALAGCLSDPAQLGLIADSSLCHGWAGLVHTAWRVARDAAIPEIANRLPNLLDHLAQHADTGEGADSGFLEGTAGLALALHTAARDQPPVSGWDACLLLN